VNINLKSLPRNLQKYDWDCGVAVVGFLMDNKGHKVTRKKLLKELGASAKRGTDLVKIVVFFKSRPEFEAKVEDKSSIELVKKELGRGKVVLVAYQNWQKKKDIGEPDWGHYGVIYKVEGDKVYLFDPGSDSGLMEFTKEEFEKRWYEDDLGVHYFHWAMSLNLM
jgi:ABC-type bacteriocin/lantibiotic exporter with double-glycine peptidase domain